MSTTTSPKKSHNINNEHLDAQCSAVCLNSNHVDVMVTRIVTSHQINSE